MWKKCIADTCQLFTKNWLPFSSLNRIPWVNHLAVYLEDTYGIDEDTRATIVNCASGDRHVSDRLSQLFPRSTIVDVDISTLRSDTAYPRFIQADFHALPLRSSSVNMIISLFGLDYAQDQHTVMAEFTRVLIPGGIAVLSLHSPYSRIIETFKNDYLRSLENMLNDRAEHQAMKEKHCAFLARLLDIYVPGDTPVEKVKNFIGFKKSIASFLLSKQHQGLFQSPLGLRSFFAAQGFKDIDILLAEKNGRLLPAHTYQTTPHDGWFVSMRKPAERVVHNTLMTNDLHPSTQSLTPSS